MKYSLLFKPELAYEITEKSLLSLRIWKNQKANDVEEPGLLRSIYNNIKYWGEGHHLQYIF